jgi:hypothetical protein
MVWRGLHQKCGTRVKVKGRKQSVAPKNRRLAPEIWPNNQPGKGRYLMAHDAHGIVRGKQALALNLRLHILAHGAVCSGRVRLSGGNQRSVRQKCLSKHRKMWGWNI